MKTIQLSKQHTLVTKRMLSVSCALCILCSILLTGCQKKEYSFDEVPDYFVNANEDPGTLWPDAIDDIEPYNYYNCGADRYLLEQKDLHEADELLKTLCFSNYTSFPEADKMPKDFDPNELLEWGKYPGLHMDVLYNHDLVGEGAVVAIIDQPFLVEHEAFKDNMIHYDDTLPDNDVRSNTNSMHGGGVTSLLVTPGIGTAPKAEIYYFEVASWKADDALKADVIQKVIDLNETLPEGKKISMLSLSDMLDREGNANQQAFHDAIDKATEAGIMVWICNGKMLMNDGAFLPLSDKDDPANIVQAAYSNATDWVDRDPEHLLTAPAGGRTTAYTLNDCNDEYSYWADGGVSWCAPYVTGLAATAHTLAPDMTQDEMITLFLKTSFKANGFNIINPVGFMAEVLKYSGDYKLANTILKEAGLDK